MRRWESLLDELDELGVSLVAISPDDPSELAAFAEKYSPRLRLLSDADLEVTDAYNLRSQKTLAIGLGRSLVRYLAIPTTLLVDRDGRVRWIDQAEDFRVRSDPRRVLGQLRSILTTS